MQFPIFPNPAEYVAKGVPMIDGISAVATTAIERLQPYHAADLEANPLRRLNRISNIDTHSRLRVVSLSFR